MSSRSREKALNAIRKLFKGNSSNNNNNNNSNNNNNNNSNNINNSNNNNNNNNMNTSAASNNNNNNNNNNNASSNTNGCSNNNNNNNNISDKTTTTTTSAEAAAAANEANANLPTSAAAAATGKITTTTTKTTAAAANVLGTLTEATALSNATTNGANAAAAAQSAAPPPPPSQEQATSTSASSSASTSSTSSSSSSSSVSSPGKRMRLQDNKISPITTKFTTSKVTVPIGVGGGHHLQPHQPDFNIRARRLMKEYKEIQRIHNTKKYPIFTVELINDSLYEWHARLHIVDPDSKLARDMVEMNIPYILLHLVFPDNFPFAPPFMRVVQPRIEKGFVMEGGAICMELLTPRGWASAYTVEALLMQFAASLVKGQGRIVRKAKSSKEFSRRNAEEAFRSLVKTHEKYGWVTPALSDG